MKDKKVRRKYVTKKRIQKFLEDIRRCKADGNRFC